MKKNNSPYDRTRRRLKDKTTRQARIARNTELNRLKDPRSFKEYAEMRDLSEYKAPIMQRLGQAAQAGWNAAKGTFNRETLSAPGNTEDNRFHNVELDLKDISDLYRKIRTPEIKKVVEKLSRNVTNWFRDGAKPNPNP